MHPENIFPASTPTATNRVSLWAALPLPLHQEVIVFIINNRELALGEWDEPGHWSTYLATGSVGGIFRSDETSGKKNGQLIACTIIRRVISRFDVPCRSAKSRIWSDCSI